MPDTTNGTQRVLEGVLGIAGRNKDEDMNSEE